MKIGKDLWDHWVCHPAAPPCPPLNQILKCHLHQFPGQLAPKLYSRAGDVKVLRNWIRRSPSPLSWSPIPSLLTVFVHPQTSLGYSSRPPQLDQTRLSPSVLRATAASWQSAEFDVFFQFWPWDSGIKLMRNLTNASANGFERKNMEQEMVSILPLVSVWNPARAHQLTQLEVVSVQLEVLIFRIFLPWVFPGFAKDKVLLDLARVSLLPSIAAALVAS